MSKEIIDYLSNIIELRQTKRKCVYISNVCPFTLYRSDNRIFRYNTKLKVAKCYHCGKSFKELSWLKLILEKPNVVELKILQTYTLIPDRIRSEVIKKYIKDKAVINDEAIEKSKMISDDDLPF